VFLEHAKRALYFYCRFGKDDGYLCAIGPRIDYAIYVKTARQIIDHVDHVIKLGYQQINVFAVDGGDKGGVELLGDFRRHLVALHLDPFYLFGVLRMILVVLKDLYEQRSAKPNLAGHLV
jgi:hypothetical protein